VASRVASDLPDWMMVQAEYDDGANSIFPVDRFKVVAKWAKPRTGRIMSVQQKAAATERLISFRFLRRP
jgi:hypothetical protein